MREDGIFDGDLVAIRRAATAENGQTVVARIDGEITIKRLKVTTRAIRLLPRNPDYAATDVPRDADFALEGLNCGLVRHGRLAPLSLTPHIGRESCRERGYQY